MALYPIRIVEGFVGHEYTNIVPARIDSSAQFGYLKNTDEEISIVDLFINSSYLGFLMKKYYCREIQLEVSPWGYDEYGETVYTKEDFLSLLGDLKSFVEIAQSNPSDPRCDKFFSYNESGTKYSNEQRDKEIEHLLDFYPRFIKRMNQMLAHTKEDEYILFVGP